MKYLKIILSTPFSVLFRKGSSKIFSFIRKYQDLHSDTRTRQNMPFIRQSCMDISKLNFSKIDREIASYHAEMYLSHRFNLLGSGWVRNSYADKAIGVEGYTYDMNVPIEKFDNEGAWLKNILLNKDVGSSSEIWKLISDKYIPIDWQKDFKSGYRWSAKKWFKEQPIGEHLGADIKVPLELARLQHLPQMALFSHILPDKKQQLILEFKNQVLDFISTNPPSMGCNWNYAMDVGIRASNMLVAYDLFSQMDYTHILDDTFKQVFANSVYEHGRHIVNNLEWYAELTTNHYLSNVASLVFIASYLEANEEINTWLAFAVQEIVTEFKKQFNQDGSNFEASTSYHRLSAELVIYSSALIMSLSREKKETLRNYDPNNWKKVPLLQSAHKQEYKLDSDNFFPHWYWDRLVRAGQFILDITKPNDEVAQIGDNDNGRFFNFSAAGKKISNHEACSKYLNLRGYDSLPCTKNDSFYWDENVLNHQTLVSAFSGIITSPEFKQSAEKFPLECSMIRTLSNNFTIDVINDRLSTGDILNVKNDIPDLHNFMCKKNNISLVNNPNRIQELKLIVYPDFGVYIYKSDSLFFLVSAGNNGQNGVGGHAHNDKLSFELNVNGVDVVADPGTYLYTPISIKRNEFRSTKAHNSIIINGVEQNDFEDHLLGLFRMKNETKCLLFDVRANSIQLSVNYKNIVHIRKFDISSDTITIYDFVNSDFEVNINKFDYYSNGYGSYSKIKRLVIA